MTLLRSLVISLLAATAALPLRSLLAESRPRLRRFAWVLLLAPYLTPPLLTGYAYANFSLSLVRHPGWNTLFYAALLFFKFTPVASLVLYFAPQPVSGAGLHCQRLLQTSWMDRLAFQLRAGFANAFLAAVALVFLFTFADFELASLMFIKSWTVTIFDAHVGGLALSESLKQIAIPLLCELLALAIAVAVLFRERIIPTQRISSGSPVAWIQLILGALLVLLIPVGIMLRGANKALPGALENFALTREIVASLLFAIATTVCVGSIALLGNGKSIWQRGAAAVFCFLGLLGPLVLSLAILSAVQTPRLLVLRDTPVPLVATLALVLMPVAFVLRLVLDATREGSSLHTASLMKGSQAARALLWRLRTSKRFWMLFLLFGWAYWDLTASAILAPITMTPVTVRLYNLMHYGQNAALSTMLFVSFLAPLLILVIVYGTRHWWARV